MYVFYYKISLTRYELRSVTVDFVDCTHQLDLNKKQFVCTHAFYHKHIGTGSYTRLHLWVSDQKIDGLHQLCFVCIDNSLAICMSPTCTKQCCQLVHQSLSDMSSCLCDNACNKSLAIRRKNSSSCNFSKLFSAPIRPA